MANTVKLRGDYVHEEAIAAGTITPGHLVMYDSDLKVVVHDSDGDKALAAFALEDSLQGNTLDDDYSSDDPVQIGIFRPGDQVNAVIEGGEAVSKGDMLVSSGNGKLRELISADSASDAIGIVMEDFDDSVDTHVAVMIV